jgi:hypothetical protein
MVRDIGKSQSMRTDSKMIQFERAHGPRSETHWGAVPSQLRARRPNPSAGREAARTCGTSARCAACAASVRAQRCASASYMPSTRAW